MMPGLLLGILLSVSAAQASTDLNCTKQDAGPVDANSGAYFGGEDPRSVLGDEKRRLSTLARIHDPATARNGAVLASTDDALSRSYWIARLELESGLLHLAHEAFEAAVSLPASPARDGTRVAAFACLNRIRDRLPSLPFAPPALSRARQLLSVSGRRLEEYAVLSDYLARQVAQAIAQGEPVANLKHDLGRLERRGEWGGYLRFLLALREGQPADRRRQAEALLANPAMIAALGPLTESVHLARAQSAYELGDFEACLDSAARIPAASVHRGRALSLSAWSSLMKHDYERSLGDAFGLLVGKAGRSFEPEVHGAIGITLIENCHASEAVRACQSFRKSYGPVNDWLVSHRSSRSSLYDALADFLQHRSSEARAPLPERVARELLKSRIFLTHQNELNALLDWPTRSARVRRALEDLPAATKESLMSSLDTRMRPWLARRPLLVRRIDDDLEKRVARMTERLTHATETLAGVEAEAYGMLGDSVILSQRQKPARQSTREPAGQARVKPTVAWAWGRFPAVDLGSAELWQDERENISARIENDCAKKK
jgi:hypothetical protein